MPFPTWASAVTATANTASRAVDIQSPANGDLVVVMVTAATGNTVNPPAGWTQIYSLASSSAATWGGAWQRVCNGSEGATASWTLGSAAQMGAISLKASAGTFTGTPEGAGFDGQFQNYRPPSVTPSWGAVDTTFVAVLHSVNWEPTTSGWPTNGDALYGNRVASSGFSARVQLERANKTVTTEWPPEFVEPFSLNGVTGTIAVRGTSSATTPFRAYGRYGVRGPVR